MFAAIGPAGPHLFLTHGITVEKGLRSRASGRASMVVSGGSMVMSRAASGGRAYYRNPPGTFERQASRLLDLLESA